jgi:hypothetical protein
MTLGLRSRKKVLNCFSSASEVTRERAGSWPSTSGSRSRAAALSGSRASVKRRLFSM